MDECDEYHMMNDVKILFKWVTLWENSNDRPRRNKE